MMNARIHALAISSLALLVLPLVFTSCASTDLVAANRAQLAQAQEKLQAGEYEPAARQMEQLLSATGSSESQYALQRFFAAYLLSRAHLEAAFGTPFLSGPPNDDPGFGAGGGADTGAQLANVVASTYYAGYGRQWHGAASKARSEKALPPELETYGLENALLHLNLVLLTSYTRLKFQDRIEIILDSMTGLRKLETCEEAMAKAQIGEKLRPWIYRGIFDYLKRHDEIAAYKFAIRALDLNRQHPDETGALTAGLATWITEKSRYAFKCPTCGDQAVDPTLPACPVCRLPNIEFEPEEKVAGANR